MTNVLMVIGQHLDPLDRVWMLDDFACEILPAAPDAPADTQRRLHIVVPDGSPAGVSALRVMGSNGVSELELVGVDDLPARVVSDAPHTPGAALVITPPVAIEGRLEPFKSDFFRLHARAGEVLSVEVQSTRIGGETDPLVRLLGPDGGELVYMDDAPGLGEAAAFRHCFAAEGDHLIEVRDALHRGGDTFRYRLRIGDVPLVGPTYPASLEKAEGELEVLGVGGAETRAVRQVLHPLGPDGAGWNLNVALEGSVLRGQAWVPASPWPCHRETEPNDAAGQAEALTPPVRVQGRWRAARDRDWYRLVVEEAQAGQTIEVRARTRALGSPCDAWMEWQAEGRSVSRLRQDAEGVLTNVFKNPGTYHLVVEELNRMGRDDFLYELDVRWLGPEVLARTDTDLITIRPGEAARLKIQLERRGYEGPVRFEVRDLPAMVELRNAVVEAGAGEGTLEIQLGSEAGAGTLLEFRVLAHAEEGAGLEPRGVSTRPALTRRFRGMRVYPPGLDGLITLGVLPGG